MALNSDLVKQFAKLVTASKETTNTTIYGTAKVSGSNITVKVDGSSYYIPVTSRMNVSDGDRVELDLSERYPLIVGNVTSFGATLNDIEISATNVAASTTQTAAEALAEAQKTWDASLASLSTTVSNNKSSTDSSISSLSSTVSSNTSTAAMAAANAAKTATNYLNYSSDGLIVGNYSSGSLSGYNVQIKSDGINIRNGTTVLATYGTNAVINNLYATTGTIGGWNIKEKKIDNFLSSSEYYVELCNGDNDWYNVLQVRTGNSTDGYKYPVCIRANGNAIFSKATITGTVTATTLSAKENIKMYTGSNTSATVMTVGDYASSNYSLKIATVSGINSIEIGSTNLTGGIAVCTPSFMVSNSSSTLSTNTLSLGIGHTTHAIAVAYSSTGEARWAVQTTKHEGWLVSTTTSGAFGLYSNTLGRWVLVAKVSGTVASGAIKHAATDTGTALIMTSSGNICKTSSSSRRYKEAITDLSIDEVSGLYSLPVRSFRYKDGYLADTSSRLGKAIPGIIAEEIEEVFPVAVEYDRADPDDEGSELVPEKWNEFLMIPALLKLIQDLNDRLSMMEAKMSGKALSSLKLSRQPSAIDPSYISLNENSIELSDEQKAEIAAHRHEEWIVLHEEHPA